MPSKKFPLPVISVDEVRIHSTPEDLWMVVYNKVYNVTKLASLHPGGADVLLDCAGTDATAAFEDVGHSQDAFDMLLPYLLGELPVGERKYYAHQMENSSEKVQVKKKKRAKPENHLLKRRILVAVLVVLAILAFIVVIGLQKLQWLNLTSY